MADLTLNPTTVAVHGLSHVPREGGGQRRLPSRRFKRSGRHATLIDDLFPDAGSDDFEVYMEFADGALIGVAIVDSHTGEALVHVPVEELTQQAEHPGLIFERAA
jgi:hypothetical protein